MISDYHLHSNFSGDSNTEPEAMIKQAQALGMKSICFTDHYDLDFPDDPDLFLFDINLYLQHMQALREKYKHKIQICTGIELGLQSHLARECETIVSSYPFDFVIGSLHVVRGMDPYYPQFFEGHTQEECYAEYFQALLDNLQHIRNFDVCGHLDYIVRYAPKPAQGYSYKQFQELIDAILQKCLENQIGFELNTGGLARGLSHPNPHPAILKRYREMGGEIVTIGSDAHQPDRLGYAFAKARTILQDCGFRYYAEFRQRTPYFIKL